MLKNFDNENISSLADNQGQLSDRQPNVSEREKYKQMAVKDINTIQNLVQSGVMTQEQGQNLMNFVTQKAFEKYTTVNAPQQSTQIDKMVGKTAQNTVMPEFFNQNGRIDVYDYLKNSAPLILPICSRVKTKFFSPSDVLFWAFALKRSFADSFSLFNAFSCFCFSKYL